MTVVYQITLDIPYRTNIEVPVLPPTLKVRVPWTGEDYTIELDDRILPKSLNKLLPNAYAHAPATEWFEFIRRAFMLGMMKKI
jgi:hypothetical protein